MNTSSTAIAIAATSLLLIGCATNDTTPPLAGSEQDNWEFPELKPTTKAEVEAMTGPFDKNQIVADKAAEPMVLPSEIVKLREGQDYASVTNIIGSSIYEAVWTESKDQPHLKKEADKIWAYYYRHRIFEDVYYLLVFSGTKHRPLKLQSIDAGTIADEFHSFGRLKLRHAKPAEPPVP